MVLSKPVLVDAHIHIYDGFPLGRLFDAAWSNFQRQAHQMGTKDFMGLLCLTESASYHCFQRLANELVGGHLPSAVPWRFTRLPEDECTLQAQRQTGETLFLIAGRQIITTERLEVLALGSTASFQDGQPIDQVLNSVRNAGALPVLPWGVGKWLGKRGTVVRRVLSSGKPNCLFLGDISSRPAFWPKGSLFRFARDRGIRVLPGTDPLPLDSEVGRPGSCGFYLDQPLSVAQPATDLKRLLRQPGVIPRPYGRREKFLRFIRNQLLIRL